MIQICRLAAVTTLVLLSGRAAWGQTPAATLFESQCATCHSGAADSRAPDRAALAVKSRRTGSCASTMASPACPPVDTVRRVTVRGEAITLQRSVGRVTIRGISA